MAGRGPGFYCACSAVSEPCPADSVLSLRLGNCRIDRILHVYHIFVHFASCEDKRLLSEFFESQSRTVALRSIQSVLIDCIESDRIF